MESCENDELGVEKTAGMKGLYGSKQKRVVVAYAKHHFVAVADKKFSIPRTTINRWVAVGYFERDITKRGVKKGTGQTLTYCSLTDEHAVFNLDTRKL